jgi:hypothetical protein
LHDFSLLGHKIKKKLRTLQLISILLRLTDKETTKKGDRKHEKVFDFICIAADLGAASERYGAETEPEGGKRTGGLYQAERRTGGLQ